jgi:hypothetical protein
MLHIAGSLQRQHSRRKSCTGGTETFAAAVAALDKSSSSSSAKGTSKVTRLQEALPCTVSALFQQLLADDARYGMVPFHTAQVCTVHSSDNTKILLPPIAATAIRLSRCIARRATSFGVAR